MKAFRNSGIACTSVILALGLSHCRTVDREDSGTKAVVVQGQGNGEDESGFTAYFVESGEVKRFRCPALILNDGSDQQLIDDPKYLKGKCNEAPSATGNKVSPKVFEAKLKSVYLVAVDDQNLTAQEAAVLANLIAALKAPPGAKPPLVLLPSEEAAMDRIQARFAGLFATAFDFGDATSEAETVTTSEALDSGGLHLAGDGVVELGQLKFKSTFSGIAPFTLTMNVPPGAAVSAISLGTTLDPSGVCKTRVVGIANVVVSTPTGPKAVSILPHPVNANSWKINNGVPAVVTRLSVAVKKPALTLSQNCLLIAQGENAAVDPTPNPPPNPQLDRDAKMKQIMASRSHRMWHYLWHGIRNSWPRMTAADRQNIRQILGAAWTRNAAETLQNPEVDKGEEFLHMHRGMIQVVQDALGAEMYERWKEPPAPNDPGFPLPGGQSFQTNQEYQQLRTWHLQALDVNRLRQMTLGQYGEFIELSLHNSMHMRWADEAKALPDVMAGGLFQTPKPEWDLPANDYLGSTYSSHVNPIFWRLHGYVDDRIDTWLKANGFTSISDDCQGVSTCYQWKRVWDGPLPAHGSPVVAAAAAQSAVAEDGAHGGFDPESFRELPKTLARLIHDNSVMFPSSAAL